MAGGKGRAGNPQVVVVGSLNMDLTTTARRFAAPGQTVLGDGFAMVPGGKGNNQAVAAARQDVSTAMVGRVGMDPFGDALRRELGAESIDASHVATDPRAPSGVAQIVVDAEGQNEIVVVPGANHTLTPDDVRVALDQLSGARVVLVQLEIPLDAVEAALAAGRQQGAITILNPAPPATLDDELLGLVDVCIPNEHEASDLAGVEVLDQRSALEAAATLRGRGCREVVITLGAEGAVHANAERAVHVPAFPVRAVDTVAAGDAFCGALAAALAAGSAFPKALLRAAAAAALSTTVAGATTSLPTAAAVDALLARHRELEPVDL